MGDRADILNRSSATGGGGAVLSNNKSRPGASKRPGSGGDGGPNSKKAKNDNSGALASGSPEFEALLLAKLPKDDESRKKELKSWAYSMVMSLGMNDLNYYLQSIKKTVESKKNLNAAKGAKGANNNSKTSTNGGVGGNKATMNNDAGGEGSADANKPSLSGSFYPMAHARVIEDEKAKKEAEKAFQRPKAERRTAEEESQYQDLLHSIAENPVVVDEELNEMRFEEIIKEGLPICKKLKDWFQIWSHSRISGNEHTVKACLLLTRLLIEEKDEEETADILSHLMKEKEISPKNMEEAIKRFMGEVPALFSLDSSDDLEADSSSAAASTKKKDIHKLIGHMLVFIYPCGRGDFGWHRVGWGFAQWWQHAKKYTKDLEKPIDCLALCTEKLLEYRAPDFSDPERQEKIIARATELLESREEACKRLKINGDPSYRPAPSPISGED